MHAGRDEGPAPVRARPVAPVGADPCDWLELALAEDRSARACFGVLHKWVNGGGVHDVCLYRTDDRLVACIADAFTIAAGRGDKLLLVATEAHRQTVEWELELRGVPVEPPLLTCFDAAEMLDRILVDGRIDGDRFEQMVARLVRRRMDMGPIYIYGEMVDLLWQSGRLIEALRLEKLWNALDAQLGFSLLCGYRVSGAATSDDLDRIRQVHSHSL